MTTPLFLPNILQTFCVQAWLPILYMGWPSLFPHLGKFSSCLKAQLRCCLLYETFSPQLELITPFSVLLQYILLLLFRVNECIYLGLDTWGRMLFPLLILRPWISDLLSEPQSSFLWNGHRKQTWKPLSSLGYAHTNLPAVWLWTHQGFDAICLKPHWKQCPRFVTCTIVITK